MNREPVEPTGRRRHHRHERSHPGGPDHPGEGDRGDGRRRGDRVQSDSAGGDRRPGGRRRILVDAANVAFTDHDARGAKGSVGNLAAMRRRLGELGFRPIFIADAALKYEVDDEEWLRRLEREDAVLEAPAGTQADYFLLAYSTREGLPIVSNDVYRDRAEEFPAAVRRRVPFMIVDGDVVVDQEILGRVERELQERGASRGP